MVPTIWGMLGPGHWNGDPGVADPLPHRNKRLLPTCVIVPNEVALSQTLWAYVWVPKIWGTLGPRPLEWAWLIPEKHACRVTMLNLDILGQTIRAYN